jgi:uncharacterized protein with GYD domain
MPKYIAIFSYSSGSWARMITNPGDRTTAARRAVEALGGSLDCLYWELGTNDGFAIGDLPDAISAGALATAITRTGAFKSVETHQLLTQEQLSEVLTLAKDAAEVYEAPGQPV